MLALQRLQLARCFDSWRSGNRDLVVALTIADILAPNSKQATTRWWQDTTLLALLGVKDADESELYGAMDWVLHARDALLKTKAVQAEARNDQFGYLIELQLECAGLVKEL